MYTKVQSISLRNLTFKILLELKVFITIFLISFLGMVVFTNADMFWEKLFAEEVKVDKVLEHSAVKVDALAFAGIPQPSQEARLEKLSNAIDEYQNNNTMIVRQDFDDVEEYLKESRKDQVFDFNVLPPTDRIVIPSVGLDVPVIDSKINNILDFSSKDFDDDLMSWVVKYPTTPVPWSNGNTLLFGHTSQEWRKNNDYSTVFNKLPEIKKWELISVVWEGKLYNYEMVGKEIVYPKWVENVYQKYQKIDEDYLTLMGCYPLGSAKKRILVIAKRVK